MAYWGGGYQGISNGLYLYQLIRSLKHKARTRPLPSLSPDVHKEQRTQDVFFVLGNTIYSSRVVKDSPAARTCYGTRLQTLFHLRERIGLSLRLPSGAMPAD